MKARLMTVVLLGVLVLLSAVGVIRAKHESRKRFVQLQALEKERDQMNVEWGQLQLEQGTWATSSRVEEIARKRLGMEIPKSESVVIIRP